MCHCFAARRHQIRHECRILYVEVEGDVHYPNGWTEYYN